MALRPIIAGGFVQVPASGGSEWTTGDMKHSAVDAAQTGWVRAQGGSIGNAASSGTERANADTVALFTLIYNAYADAQCPVSGGRGASAAADFAANKNLTLPASQGRVMVAIGGIAPLSTLGAQAGADTHTLTEAQLPIVAGHSHAISMDSGAMPGGSGTTALGTDAAPNATPATSTAGGFGSGDPHNNIQPSLVIGCVLIKL